ncbi:GNAT family N-acetyltransferase [Arthrobacter jiangjiafuii]|uniref:GNAT family N-acetyltransferase n=1 Tax=Arthrobacter jiangjiafuii TaxID=2817475 RepID=A0A975QZQ3_9MICC|nr:GNAT family N-acetyltransferase [Arthrobacter jiangjiafuii]MBP3043045.1 GNAT family N-acetyltransferase [Arthrobacter jiangjiafuii]QWC08614.1 GNAT family N-acetyltransferase [Arthrobacter jiangjiafuii]
MEAGNRRTSVLETPRLILEPLVPGHAVEMVPVLAHPALYEFTGGRAPTVEELTHRYLLQSLGPGSRSRATDGSTQKPEPLDEPEIWLNWIIRTRNTALAAGFVQATVRRGGKTDNETTAELAWVVGRKHQGRGYATEAAQAMVIALTRCGVARFAASIHPGNGASAGVAERLGLLRTGIRDADGEDLWQCEAGPG